MAILSWLRRFGRPAAYGAGAGFIGYEGLRQSEADPLDLPLGVAETYPLAAAGSKTMLPKLATTVARGAALPLAALDMMGPAPVQVPQWTPETQAVFLALAKQGYFEGMTPEQINSAAYTMLYEGLFDPQHRDNMRLMGEVVEPSVQPTGYPDELDYRQSPSVLQGTVPTTVTPGGYVPQPGEPGYVQPQTTIVPTTPLQPRVMVKPSHTPTTPITPTPVQRPNPTQLAMSEMLEANRRSSQDLLRTQKNTGK